MEIKELVKDLDYINIKNMQNFNVSSLSCKSGEENLDGIYFCLRGTKKDGHDYIKEAEVNGAKCLVVERFVDSPLMQILVSNSRKSMTDISAKYFGADKTKMKFVGITGTNGKTTTSFLVKAYLTKLGKSVGLIGTQGIYFNHMMLPANLTTPDPIELYKIIHEMEKNGVEYVVMEASAHAIALQKVDGIKYDVVGLTNITRDHLDYFKTMDNYASAKQKLLSLKHTKKAIINIDDDYTRNIADYCDADKTTISLYDDADLYLEDYDFGIRGTKAVIKAEGETLPVRFNLLGKYNLSNLMMAISILHNLGFEYEEIVNVVNTTRVNVPGRFNVLETPTDYAVVVDFAHTPDGVENVLKTARELTNGRIISVFGCGGDRDNTKRKIMGQLSENLADYSIVTSDNPRTENPNLIIKEITENMKRNFETITDRRKAISRALELARKGDVVLILGKGAENYQEINGVKYPYSDYEVVDEYFKTKDETVEI